MTEYFKLKVVSMVSGYGEEGYCEIFEAETKAGTRYVIAYYGIDEIGGASRCYRGVSLEKVAREYIYEDRKYVSQEDFKATNGRVPELRVPAWSLVDSW